MSVAAAIMCPLGRRPSRWPGPARRESAGPGPSFCRPKAARAIRLKSRHRIIGPITRDCGPGRPKCRLTHSNASTGLLGAFTSILLLQRGTLMSWMDGVLPQLSPLSWGGESVATGDRLYLSCPTLAGAAGFETWRYPLPPGRIAPKIARMALGREFDR